VRLKRSTTLLLLLLAQSAWFAFFVATGSRKVEQDNPRYEEAGWNIARGLGLSLPRDMIDDPTVMGWLCARHPEACVSDPVPTAIYPPGYSFVIAPVYYLAGRSVPVLLGVHGVLLLLMFFAFERVANKLLDEKGYSFVVLSAATYPFLARMASTISSDHVHTVLLFLACAFFYLARPGLWRGAVFGSVVSLATLTRPYAMFMFPVAWLTPSIVRRFDLRWREWLLGGILFTLPLAGWTARNAYWFGRFIPFSTTTLSLSIYMTTLEMENSVYDPKDAANWYEPTLAAFGGDLASVDVGLKAKEKTKERIRQHPFKFAGVLALHGPKLWVSLGYWGKGMSRSWPLMVLYLGSLMVLGFLGMWFARGDPTFRPVIVTVLVYWLFLLPCVNGEARRTLPLRLPLLILAGVAASRLWPRWMPQVEPKPAHIP
jgi:hypothetical protein